MRTTQTDCSFFLFFFFHYNAFISTRFQTKKRLKESHIRFQNNLWCSLCLFVLLFCSIEVDNYGNDSHWVENSSESSFLAHACITVKTRSVCPEWETCVLVLPHMKMKQDDTTGQPSVESLQRKPVAQSRSSSFGQRCVCAWRLKKKYHPVVFSLVYTRRHEEHYHDGGPSSRNWDIAKVTADRISRQARLFFDSPGQKNRRRTRKLWKPSCTLRKKKMALKMKENDIIEKRRLSEKSRRTANSEAFENCAFI